MGKKMMNFKNEVASFEYTDIMSIFNEKMINELEKKPTPTVKKIILKSKDKDLNMSHISSSSFPLYIHELIKKGKYIDLLFNVIKNELDSDGKRIITRVKWMTLQVYCYVMGMICKCF